MSKTYRLQALCLLNKKNINYEKYPVTPDYLAVRVDECTVVLGLYSTAITVYYCVQVCACKKETKEELSVTLPGLMFA